MKTFWRTSRSNGTTLDTAKVLGVKKKPLGLVLAMSLAALMIPLAPANATATVVATPNNGTTSGNTAVALAPTGGNTDTPTAVTFGGASATLDSWDATNVYVHTPAHSAGAVDVVVTYEDSSFKTGLSAYTYIGAHTVTYVGNGNDGGTVPASSTADTSDNITVSGNTGLLTKAGYHFTGWNDQTDVNYAGGSSYSVPNSNVTFTAEWTANTLRTITYDANGGTGTAPTQAATSFGASITVAANTFTRSGYTFTGWNTAANGSGTAKNPSDSYTVPNANTTFYAIWSLDTYTITYDPNGGTGSASDTFTVISPATLNSGSGFAFVGHVFLGWRTTADGSGTFYSAGASYSTPGTLTLHAVWSGTYSITYDNNTGSGTHTDASDNSFVYDTPTTLFDNTGNVFTKGGFVFSGWTLTADVAPAITTYSTPANVTVHAYWKYTVTYTNGGGTGSAPTQANVPKGTGFTVAANTFTKTGYHFVKWTNGVLDYAPTDAYPASVNGAVTLIAVWAANFNTVTYELGGGSGTAPTQANVPSNGTFTVAASTGFSRTGYTFSHWNDGTNNYAPSDTYTVGTSDVTLTAVWDHNSYDFAITYDANGGTGTMAADTGTAVTHHVLHTNTFTRVGHTFTGWNTQAGGGGTSYSDGEDIDLLANLTTTLYAQWSHDSFAYTIHYAGGEGASGSMGDQSGTDTSTVVQANGFTKTGYSFTGWSSDYQPGDVIDITAPLEITLTAQWSHNSYPYTVTYDPGTGTGTPFIETGTATGFTVSEPTGFTKTGYAFQGWSDGYDPGDTYDLLDTTTVTLYAQWYAYDYSITYNPGSGTGSEYTDSGTALTYTVNGVLPFTKTGYVFDYWVGSNSDTYTAGELITFSDSLTVTLTAQWQLGDYTIHFDSNTADSGSKADMDYVTNDPATILGDQGTLVKAGYYFKGWTTTVNNWLTHVTSLSPTSNTTVYAFWSNTYSITYDSNTATSADAPGYYADDLVSVGGDPFVIENEGNLFHKTNYTFIGWGTTPEAPLHYNATPVSRVFQVTLTSDITLYALWSHVTRFYQITFDAGTGTGTMAIQSGNTDYLTLNANAFTKDGYTFDHWSQTSPTATTYTDQEIIDLTGTFVRTLTAIWTPITYTITYNANGGTGSSDSQTYTSGDSATTLHNTPGVARDGYTFGGWKANNEGSVVTSYNSHANVTMYAYWVPITYAIHYDTNTATSGSVPSDDSYATGAEPTALQWNPNNLAKTGYDFAGWTTSVDSATTLVDHIGPITNDVTVYAYWTPATYTIHYDSNTSDSGSTPSDQTYTTGDDPTTLYGNPNNLGKAGYVFGGWTTTVDSATTLVTEIGPITSDVTVYALWTPGTYTIFYDTNTGNGGGVPDNSYYTTGDGPTELYGNPNNLSKTGYTWSGWSTVMDSETTVVEFVGPITADTTVYAYWTPNTYTITYDTNTGDSGAVPEDSFYTTGDDPTHLYYNPNNLGKVGYDFGGWTTTMDSATTLVTDIEVSHNTTVYALWNPHTYTIYYDSNTSDGGAVPDNSFYTTGDDPTLLYYNPNDLSKTGYVFSGWSTTIDSATTVVEFVGPITSDTTVYAYWTPGTYVITYDSNTGDSGSMDTDTYTTEGDPLSLAENNFSKAHYNFGGWSFDQCAPDSECTLLGDTITVTTDTTVYATWNPQTYTIYYDTTTATAGHVNSDTYTWGRGGLELPASPFGSPTVTKLHYTFGGWYYGSDSLTVYTDLADSDSFIAALEGDGDNVTLHALWNLAIYHIHYNANGGTGSIEDGTYTSGDDPTTLHNGVGITRANFSFAGWTTSPNNSGTAISTYASEGDITVYAFWVPVLPATNTGGNTVISNPAPTVTAISPTPSTPLIAHAVTITGTNFLTGATVLIGGLAATSVAFVNSTTITAVTSAALTAGTFNVTVTNPDAQSATGVSLYTLAAAPVVTTYVVTYDTQGGSAVAAGSYVAGGSTQLPGAPTRAGFTFNGWFLAATGGTALGATYSPPGTGNITIFAQWTAIPVATVFTVTFDGNGSTGGSTAAQSGSAPAPLTANGFTRTGYNFSAWSTNPAGGTFFANGVSYGFTASVTLYAQWTAIAYPVSYDSQGGSAANGGSTSYTIGGVVALPGAPTQAGFTFDGWFLAADGGSALGDSFSPTGTGAITIYAHWTGKKATVTYNSRGGSDVAKKVTTVGTDITLANAPTRGGYSFTGWFTAEKGGTALDSPYTVTGNVTLFAHWKAPKLVGFALFANGISKVVAANTIAGLNTAADAIVAGNFTNISLTGYFSQVGLLSANLKLAADRAAAAKAYLVKRLAKLGYDGVTSWTVNGSAAANFGSDANNRRVQIYGS